MMPARDELVSLIEIIARFSSDTTYYQEIHRFFESLLPYLNEARTLGNHHFWRADHYKFFIHEVFLYAVAALLKHDRFAELNEITISGYLPRDGMHRREPALVNYTVFATDSRALEEYNDRLPNGGYRSIYAHFLNERAKRDDIEFQDLTQADFFLYLLNEIDTKPGEMIRTYWYPDTIGYAERMYKPYEIFIRAQSEKYFERLRVSMREITKEQLQELARKIDEDKNRMFSRTKIGFLIDAERIASRP